MSRRVLGYVLVSAAMIGGILVLTFVEGFDPKASFVRNLSRAELFSTYRLVSTMEACPSPKDAVFLWSVPDGCPSNEEEYERLPNQHYLSTRYITTFTLNLGVGLAVLAAIALSGIGLLVFGHGQQR